MARSSSPAMSSKSWCMAASPTSVSSAAQALAMKSLIEVTVVGLTATEHTTLCVTGEASLMARRRSTEPSSPSMGTR